MLKSLCNTRRKCEYILLIGRKWKSIHIYPASDGINSKIKHNEKAMALSILK